jgi:hypothetical protein
MRKLLSKQVSEDQGQRAQKSRFVSSYGMLADMRATRKKASTRPSYDTSTGEDQKRLMHESVGLEYAPPRRIADTPGDYGADPLGFDEGGVFRWRMVPSGDVVDKAEHDRRLARVARRQHATKKTPAQLQREIDEALAGTAVKPISESSYLGGLRYKTETYGPGGNRPIPDAPTSSKKPRKSKTQRARESAEALEKSQRWLVMFQMPGSQWSYVAVGGSGNTMNPDTAFDFGSREAAESRAEAMQGPRSSLRAKVTSQPKV